MGTVNLTIEIPEEVIKLLDLMVLRANLSNNSLISRDTIVTHALLCLQKEEFPELNKYNRLV